MNTDDYQNYYEEPLPVYYNGNDTVLQRPTTSQVKQANGQKQKQAASSNLQEKTPATSNLRTNAWRVIGLVIGLTIIALLCVVLLQQQQNTLLSESLSNNNKVAHTGLTQSNGSCLELLRSGEKRSGIYQVQLAAEHIPTELFCDMDSDGGGWTLVASVQEDDINAKCSRRDRWSDYVNVGEQREKSNWENEMIFGDVRHAMVDDYKSSAYHRIQASNVMIWHVPSGVSLHMVRAEAKLRYRTTNDFLRQHGGNLQKLYRYSFPLEPTEDHDGNDILKQTIKSFTSIKNSLTGWYEHDIPSGRYYVIDSEMFISYGNRIYLSSDDPAFKSQYIYYGRDDRYWSSSLTTPFTFLALIRNDFKKPVYYELKGRSYRYSTTIGVEFEGNKTNGNFRLEYRAVQFYESDNTLHSECRIHFYVANTEDWQSDLPDNFYKRYESTASTSKSVYYRIDGRPSRILFGYVFLTRKAGQRYSSNDIDKVASLILQRISLHKNMMDAWRNGKTSLAVPVTFDVGTEETVMEYNPPMLEKFIQPGYIQFRAYNYIGYPNALCPGFRVNSSMPEYVCVGGVSNDVTSHGTCGDFAGWRGTASDSVSLNEAVGFAHSSADISESLLIFYR